MRKALFSFILVVAGSLAQSQAQPDLAPFSLGPAGGASLITNRPNPVVSVIFGVTNAGAGPTAANYYDRLYFSTNATFETQDPAIGYYYANPVTQPVVAGATYWRTNEVTLPVTASGVYYLIVRADDENTVAEGNNLNNTLIVPITYTLTPPDLTHIAAGMIGGNSYTTNRPTPELQVYFGVTNAGGYASTVAYYDRLYFSTNSTYEVSDPAVGYYYANPVLTNVPVGGTYWRTNTITLPATASGNYYLLFRTDDENTVYEADNANNLLVIPITYTLTPPDLTHIAAGMVGGNSFTTNRPNPELQVYFGVTNAGGYAGTVAYYDRVYFSTNSAYENNDPALGYYYANLVSSNMPVGGTYWRTNTVTLPVTASGNYYLLFRTDDDNNVYEADNANNLLVIPITYTLTPPDLTHIAAGISGGNSYTTNRPNPELQVYFGVTNAGGYASTVAYYDRVYFSTNSTYEVGDPALGYYYANLIASNLPVGGTYWRTNTVTLPVTTSGNYYLLFRADDDNNVYEANNANNLLVIPITYNLVPPDLVVSSVLMPGGTSLPPTPANPSVQIVFSVANQGPGPSAVAFYDRIFLSTNDVLEAGDPAVGYYYANLTDKPVASGGSYWRTNVVTLPITVNGTYFLIVRTDDDNSVYEADNANNTRVLSFSFGQPSLPTHRFTNVRHLGSSVELTLEGSVGAIYGLEASADILNPNSWVELFAFVCDASPMKVYDPSPPATGPRFYRLTKL